MPDMGTTQMLSIRMAAENPASAADPKLLHRLYQHHTDRNGGLLQDGGNGNAGHGNQLFSVEDRVAL